MNYGGYIWKITNGDSIAKLLDASVGESFESDTFLLAKLKWQIIVFPNGWNEESKGVFHVCLKLLSFKSKWEELIICRSIQCLETKSSCTLITNYEKNGEIKSWKNGTLLLSELYQMKSVKTLTFQISIDVLKICLKNKKNECSLYSNLSNPPKELEQQQHFCWTVDEDLLNKFRISYPCKSFESKRYKHRMWCLRAYPNGINQRDKCYVGLYLTLCKLPSHLSKIKVLFTLRCKEFKGLNHSRIKDFSYLDKSSWGVSRFFDCEKLYKLRTLTIFADITIMNEYDEDGNEIMDNLVEPLEGSRSYAQNAFTPSKSQTITMYHPDEEKVSALDLSRTMSSNLRLRHRSLSNISSIKQQHQSIHRQDVQSMIQREVKKEINELQNGYNMKLNSLCSIVEQIQINNDRLSSQTYEMMNTVNKICNSLKRERANYIEEKHVLQLQNEMKSIKQIILQNQPRKVSRVKSRRMGSRHSSIECPIYYNDDDDVSEDEMSEEVAMWLMNEVKLPQYIDNFLQNGFDDMDSVSDMSLAELDLIGISKLGHKKKLYRCIGELLEGDEEEETQLTNTNEDPLQIIHDHNMFMRNTHKSMKSLSYKRPRHKSVEQNALMDGHLKVKKIRHPTKRMSMQEMYSEIPLNERSYSSNL